ncbi:hypothetical protein D9O50_05915 [Oxalobacteraceae bacterium CAVE-383]|nr:hypothetical protein D9O50_05915 [Oxalobacteraceae bacterium CAVE-383]
MPDAADIPERLVVAKGQVFEANNVWLGLEIDSHPGCEASQMATIAAGIVANVVEERARAALRMRGQSFFLLNDEMKFLSLVFSADACALVEKKTGLAQRLHVAAFASFGRKENFEEHLQVFKKLYKFRNGIVHQGKSFGELGITAKECLIMMDNILCCCIDAAIREGWTTKAEVKHAIDARLLSFGVPTLTPGEDVDEETGPSLNI